MGQGPVNVLKTASLERFQIQSADIGLTLDYDIGFQVGRRDSYGAFGHGRAVADTSMLLIDRAKGIGEIVFSGRRIGYMTCRY